MLRSDKKTVEESRRRLGNATVLARLRQVYLDGARAAYVVVLLIVISPFTPLSLHPPCAQILVSIGYGIRKDAFVPPRRHHDAGLAIKVDFGPLVYVTSSFMGSYL